MMCVYTNMITTHNICHDKKTRDYFSKIEGNEGYIVMMVMTFCRVEWQETMGLLVTCLIVMNMFL